MAYDPVRLRTVAASLRRVALSRGLRRLVVVTGLAVAGWLLGGLASQAAHADTAPVPSDGEAGRRLHDVVRGVAAAFSGKAGNTVERSQPPSVETPISGESGGDADARPDDAAASPRRPATEGARRVSAPKPVRAERAEAKPRPAAQPRKRRASVLPAQVVTRDGAVRGEAHAETPRPAPAAPAPAPAAPAPMPDQQVGTLAGGTGPVLPGGGLGGHLTRWSWQAPPRLWAPVRAPRSIPVAVRTAVDEPSFSPD